MKRTILSVVIMLGIFGLGMLVGGLKSQPVATTVAVAAPAPAASAVPAPARCPSIHEAIDQLRSAETTLREARHDFCGHKADAMRVVHEAIGQLRAAEDCAQCR